MNSMLEYKGYHASVEYDAEDDILVGEVFGITDSLNFHGRSLDEIKKMFQQSIDNYLELCEKIGKNPDKEFKGTFNVRISPEIHKKAALEAARQKITLNQYVAKAIAQSFEIKEEAKEMVILIPGEKTQTNWENYMDLNFASGYNRKPVWKKEENLKYAGN